MILQLDPPLPVITPKGSGLAHFLIDYSIESHLYWTVFMDGSGECWTFSNPEIRMSPNPTVGRPAISEIRAQSTPKPVGKPSGLSGAMTTANG